MFYRLRKLAASGAFFILCWGSNPSLTARYSISWMNVAMAEPAATSPEVIRTLAAQAYVWGLAPEFVKRFSKYNSIVSKPINALAYVAQPAAWNNAATNAGDASVIYINGFTDFTKVDKLVLTVPPSRNEYYVVNYLDNYINTIGSIGTRTTPSNKTASYLLVGPGSRYAQDKTAEINGYVYPVMASDTNLNWMLIRIRANTLIDTPNQSSVTKVYKNVSQKFALNTLRQFEKNGHKPVYPKTYIHTTTPDEVVRAKPYKNTPKSAVKFFKQLGRSLRKSQIPSITTGLSGTSLTDLPPYVVPQYGAKDIYLVPAFGQRGELDAFAPIGVSENGFQIPNNWGPVQRQALQEGYEQGQQNMNAFIAGNNADASTNYWTILNSIIGTYPNNQNGYVIRAAIVLNGGSANIPADAVYPNMQKYNGNTQLDGNSTYSITFTPPGSSNSALPVSGIYPPLVSDKDGKAKGFWAITVYQPDPTEVSAPFLTQASVLNNYYSTPDAEVLSVDEETDVMTVNKPKWGVLVESTPILFDSGADSYGLKDKSSNAVYYIATTPTQKVDQKTRIITYSFKISEQWVQSLSAASVPIQYSGKPGAIVDLRNGSGALKYGIIKPVSQLGSQQLDAGQLEKNPDGSLTLWIGPTLPAGAFASNWIPTPSTAYYSSIYGSTASVSTQLQAIMRMYYPTPGDEPPSILPYQEGSTRLPESYIPPAMQVVD